MMEHPSTEPRAAGAFEPSESSPCFEVEIEPESDGDRATLRISLLAIDVHDRPTFVP